MSVLLTAHEVVEVDGFVFKRKRRVPPGKSDNLAPPDSAAKRARVDSRGGSEHADSDASVHPFAAAPAVLRAPVRQHWTPTSELALQQGHVDMCGAGYLRHVPTLAFLQASCL